MRSGTNCTITSGEVYSWSRECLLEAKLVKDPGPLCTAAVVLAIVLRGTVDFRLGRVLRPGPGAIRPRGPDGLGRRAAQDVGGAGTSTQRGPGGLTLGVYTHVELPGCSAAVESLPAPPSEVAEPEDGCENRSVA
jgi:hypothetical protein